MTAAEVLPKQPKFEEQLITAQEVTELKEEPGKLAAAEVQVAAKVDTIEDAIQRNRLVAVGMEEEEDGQPSEKQISYWQSPEYSVTSAYYTAVESGTGSDDVSGRSSAEAPATPRSRCSWLRGSAAKTKKAHTATEKKTKSVKGSTKKALLGLLVCFKVK
jgi:hypothetical protein